MDRNSDIDNIIFDEFQSPSTRRAWIEIIYEVLPAILELSPSTRRAWIEIKLSLNAAVDSPVALHPEGVDRNNMAKIDISKIDVALHPEGVDRNLIHDYFFAKSLDVALHPEGVGRTQIVTLDFWT